MVLAPPSILGPRWRGTLSEPLTMDVATYLRYFDLPVPGAHLEDLGVMTRAFIGTVLNQLVRAWGVVTELAEATNTSRETLYTIAARICEGVWVQPCRKEQRLEPSREIAARICEGVWVQPNGRRSVEVKVPEPTAVPAYL